MHMTRSCAQLHLLRQAAEVLLMHLLCLCHLPYFLKACTLPTCSLQNHSATSTVVRLHTPAVTKCVLHRTALLVSTSTPAFV
jgi:hypothetical protein